MQDLLQWAATFHPAEKSWLLLGKGPSFRRLSHEETALYYTCALNHVVREGPVTLAHIIDIDVVVDCAEAIDRNARFLALPYRPHVHCHSSSKTIKAYLKEIPLLKKLDAEGRLVWYNLSTTEPYGDSPVIRARYFSAEAAVNLLAACGVKTVRSLGVDGGTAYSDAFQDLAGTTLLKNRQPTFDLQFEGIARTIRETGLFYAPLHLEAPIRVFVGTDAAQMMGVRVLEYSIKKHTPMTVEVQPIDDREIPVPRNPRHRSRTGFSFSRFHIPALCGYQGRAIYLDADMQVFKDLTALWTFPMDGAALLYADWPGRDGRKPQFSVLLMNCAELHWDVREIVQGLDEGQYSYEELMYQCCLLPEGKKKAALPPEWNSLEHYEEGRTCLIHYTDMTTQPWVSHDNPHGRLWYAALREALEEGFIKPEELYGAVKAGHVSPELPGWIGLPSPEGYEVMKRTWVPPHRRFAERYGWRGMVRKMIPAGIRSRVKRWWRR